MDEPSTGLDPASRKCLWNVIRLAKQDRAIILTSNLTHSFMDFVALYFVSSLYFRYFSLFYNLLHNNLNALFLFLSTYRLIYIYVCFMFSAHSMEEAEALCDRLGIFVDGSLQCVGNPKEVHC
jgi:ABC-type multidrug transport system ATPase subunit